MYQIDIGSRLFFIEVWWGEGRRIGQKERREWRRGPGKDAGRLHGSRAAAQRRKQRPELVPKVVPCARFGVPTAATPLKRTLNEVVVRELVVRVPICD